MSATSAVSSATAVPAPPIAMPTVACASAGASFTPSPTIATCPCCAQQLADGGDLVLRQQLGPDLVHADLAARSPRPRRGCRPSASRAAAARARAGGPAFSRTPSRGRSATPSTPSHRGPCRTTIVLRPRRLEALDGRRAPPRRSRRPAPPTAAGCRSPPSRRPPTERTPRAVMLSRVARPRASSSRSAPARRTTACASGCCDCCSTAAATRQQLRLSDARRRHHVRDLAARRP